MGGEVLMETRVETVHIEDGRATGVTLGHGGERRFQPAPHVISSMPMSELVAAMDPPPPAEVAAAGADLHYRDFLTVALVVPAEAGFPDNWIYVHAPDVEVGRIQNFGQWSPYMVQRGHHLPRPRVLRASRATSCGTPTTTQLIEKATRELDVPGPGDARTMSSTATSSG